MAIITDANIPTTGIGGPSPAPDYTPPSIVWKDADEIYVPKGRYYKAGYRFGGQYQDLSNLSAYWDVSDRFAVDVDATYSAGSTSGMVGGDMLSSWYSVFMVDSDEILLLPFIRVDTISYSAPSTTITTAAHSDGTTESNGWVSAVDCFNGYRLVLINDDPTESGNIYTIADTGTSPVDNLIITGDITADVAATEWLQMIPPEGTGFLFLGTVYFKSDGNLREFRKYEWEYTIRPAPNINGVKGGTPGMTDLGAAIPPTAVSMSAKPYVLATSTSIGGIAYYGTSGTDKVGQSGFYINESTALQKNIHNTSNIPITVPGRILNNFYKLSGGSPDDGYFEIYSYKE